jgi:prepilin-type N-terminal cleavage/methylation domain-containing protein
MLKNLRKNNKGFTIIEVLIVLAIAGLIMLIVFLAVPSLQRQSRNTQVRNDVSTMLGYINEYASNNNGALPAAVCADTATGNVRFVASGTCNPTTSPLAGKIRSGVTVSSNTAVATPVPTPAPGTMTVYLGHECAGTAPAAATTSRAIAIHYVIETAGADSSQCTES